MSQAVPIILGTVGAVIGAPLGPWGAQIGWAIGSTIGGLIVGPPKQKVTAQALTDLTVTGTDYGQPIPYVEGHPAIAGQFWWNTDRRTHSHTTTSGGKGGSPEVESTTYTYDMDVLIGLTDNEIVGVTRIWRDGKLIWTSLSTSSPEALAASEASEHWTRMTVYTGEITQEADPTYQAALLAEGRISDAADAPAYRGRGYVFIEGLQLGGGGQVPNLTFEVTTKFAAASIVVDVTEVAQLPQLTAGIVGVFEFSDAGWIGMQQAGGLSGMSANAVRFIPGSGYTTTQSGISVPGDAAASESHGNADVSSIVWSEGISAPHVILFTEVENLPRFFQCPSNPGKVAYSRVGNNLCVVSHNGILPGIIYRWTISSSTPSGAPGNPSTAPLPAATSTNRSPTIYVSVAIVSDKVYALTSGGVDIDVFDFDTLTYIETIAGPGTGGTGRRIWPGKDNATLWYGYCPSGVTSNFYERIDGAWVLKVSVGDGGAGGSYQFFTALNVSVGIFERHIWVGGYSGGNHVATKIGPIETTDPDDELLVDVIARQCQRGGLTAAQYDTSGLSGITRKVRSLPVSQVTPPLSVINLLAATHFFDYYCTDKVYFVARGGASVLTVPYTDLGATKDLDVIAEPFAPREANEVEIPAQIALSYHNVNDDYLPGTETSDRMVSALTDSMETYSVAIGLTPSEAKQIADVMLLDRAVSRMGVSISLLGNYTKLTPTDVITVTAEDGSTFRMRIVEVVDSFPMQQYQLVLDNAAILTSQGITSADYTSTTEVAPAVDTEMALLDIPILRDADDDAGIYGSTRGSGTPYPGSSVMKSNDDVSYTNVATITESGTIGTCTTVLGDWDGPPVFDEHNSVTVNVGANGTLSSSTRAALLADSSINAFAIGVPGRWELGQFRTATLVSPGVFKLTGLLRGMRGTEQHMVDHTAGETFVLLGLSGMRRIVLGTNELGDLKYWRGVTLGRSLESATAVQLTPLGVGLMPFSPTRFIALLQTNGDIEISWERRSRLATRGLSTLGQSIPLGEESEEYVLEFSAVSTPETIVRTETVTTNSFTYTSAMRTADSLSLGSIHLSIRQMSAEVGRGFATERTT